MGCWDPYSRDKYGCPPKSYGDLAFVQHMIASLKPQGKLGVVLPHGILFRGGAEGRIREGILGDDLIEAIIGLAPNLFYGTGIPASVLIINRDKPSGRKGKVLFIHGAEEMIPGKIRTAYPMRMLPGWLRPTMPTKTRNDSPGIVDLEEIKGNDWNLNIARYVDSTEPEEQIDVAEEYKKLKELTAKGMKPRERWKPT